MKPSPETRAVPAKLAPITIPITAKKANFWFRFWNSFVWIVSQEQSGDGRDDAHPGRAVRQEALNDELDKAGENGLEAEHVASAD